MEFVFFCSYLPGGTEKKAGLLRYKSDAHY
jgi:hypothetical protein